MSSTGTCFDIGTTTASALGRFRDTGDPLAGSADPATTGNGCIMRAVEYAAASARTTHAADECLDAAELLASILVRALGGQSKPDVVTGPRSIPSRSATVAAVARAEYLSKPRDHIRGSGHVVACLEAALWALARSQDVRDAILLAVNLGEDADTTAAVCGQVAGAYYGESGIPGAWLDRLAMRDEIARLADALRTQR